MSSLIYPSEPIRTWSTAATTTTTTTNPTTIEEDSCNSENISPAAQSYSASYTFFLPPQSIQDEGKLTVVLDIDETLVHTEFLPDTINLTPEKVALFNANCSAHFFCLYVKGQVAIVRKRPFLSLFLTETSKKFELVTFTAGSDDYANALLDHLDPTGQIFRHRLFRQHCVGNGWTKDLRVLNRDLKRTVLVDNSHNSFLLQPANGVPIESFIDDMCDQALIMLYDFLDRIKNELDVRCVLRSIFKLESKLGNLRLAMLSHHRENLLLS